MKDLSIIIISYNTRQSLKKCLESLSGQGLVIRDQRSGIRDQGSDVVRKEDIVQRLPVTAHRSPITEVIVVDNGSSDGSVGMVRGMVAGYQGPVTSDQGSGVRNLGSDVGGKNIHRSLITSRRSPVGLLHLIENQKNLGFAKGVNQALRQVKGELILLLNSDTQINSGTLGKLIEFEDKVRPAIIGVRLLNLDGSPQPSVFHLPTIRNAVSEYWFGKKDAFSKYLPTGDRPVEVDAVVGGAMLISRKVIEKVGFFDERYFMYFEDLDYCRRASKDGFKIWYLPETEIIHEHGASGRNLASTADQWRRLIPSSKIYHGLLKHYLISFILWSGQKWRRS